MFETLREMGKFLTMVLIIYSICGLIGWLVVEIVWRLF